MDYRPNTDDVKSWTLKLGEFLCIIFWKLFVM